MSMRACRIAGLVLTAGTLFASHSFAALTHQWTKQFGTSTDDTSRDVSVGSDNRIYVGGNTKGTLGHPNAGSWDGFVRRFDASGGISHTRQFGTSGFEFNPGVVAEPVGGAIVVGGSHGSLYGTQVGSGDAVIANYSSTGVLLWSDQLGSSASDLYLDVAQGLGGNVVAVGSTLGNIIGTNAGSRDVLIRKYSSTGSALWTRQFGGTSLDTGNGVAIDHVGNIYVVGQTSTHLGVGGSVGEDAFVRKYSSTGTEMWTRQIGGLGNEDGVAITVRHGDVYITGHTTGSVEGTNAGGTDMFASKIDGTTGGVAWTKQFGTSGDDVGGAIAVDADGHVFIHGRTGGALGGAHLGGIDAFLMELAADGTQLWSDQYGTIADEGGDGISLDDLGNVYVTGRTEGTVDTFGGSHLGGEDGYLRKYSGAAIPEPSVGVVMFGGVMLACRRRKV
ncbi:SBBP repeat-containing protein [Poriferisphaera sp. WC338]|uniref:SBBP repeat-containing protein n=1 Tax=Poriferisphaera sp. WC338 TaxID=3425129 RepID=UPI003D814BEE